MSDFPVIASLGVTLYLVYVIGYMMGDIAAMKREEKQRAELQRIREGQV